MGRPHLGQSKENWLRNCENCNWGKCGNSATRGAAKLSQLNSKQISANYLTLIMSRWGPTTGPSIRDVRTLEGVLSTQRYEYDEKMLVGLGFQTTCTFCIFPKTHSGQKTQTKEWKKMPRKSLTLQLHHQKNYLHVRCNGRWRCGPELRLAQNANRPRSFSALTRCPAAPSLPTIHSWAPPRPQRASKFCVRQLSHDSNCDSESEFDFDFEARQMQSEEGSRKAKTSKWNIFQKKKKNQNEEKRI